MNTHLQDDNYPLPKLQYLLETGILIAGILDHRHQLPWKTLLDEAQLSVLVGDELITYLVSSLDIQELILHSEHYNLIIAKPFLRNYYSQNNFHDIVGQFHNGTTEIIYTKSELEIFILLVYFLDYNSELIAQFENMKVDAPDTFDEAEETLEAVQRVKKSLKGIVQSKDIEGL